MILHTNIQSIHNKYEQVESLLQDTVCDVICLSETWAYDHQLPGLNLEGFELATYFNRKLFMHGGTAIFIKSGRDYKIRKDLNRLACEMNCELCAIELRCLKIVIVCIYRAGNDIDSFLDKLEMVMHRLCREGKKMIIAGDYNLDILIDTNKIRKFNSIIEHYNCKYVI